ncbi:MAG: Hsp20 family protein, partial [Oscillospiraceae bacterium]|nr:Hsp20 family protein [Oscillospiraceae bacterium]
DIRARFADGVLTLDIPKKEKAAPEKKYITIGD